MTVTVAPLVYSFESRSTSRLPSQTSPPPPSPAHIRDASQPPCSTWGWEGRERFLSVAFRLLLLLQILLLILLHPSDLLRAGRTPREGGPEARGRSLERCRSEGVPKDFGGEWRTLRKHASMMGEKRARSQRAVTSDALAGACLGGDEGFQLPTTIAPVAQTQLIRTYPLYRAEREKLPRCFPSAGPLHGYNWQSESERAWDFPSAPSRAAHGQSQRPT